MRKIRQAQLYTATLVTRKVVIPAPLYNGINSSRPAPRLMRGIQTSSLRKQGTSIFRTGFPRIKYGAGLVKPGMTNFTRLMSPRIKGVFWGIVVSSALFVVTSLDHIAFAQTTRDDAASAMAFVKASQVFFHPRCVNCHPAGDAPLQGDESRPHTMNVKRGPEGQGTKGVRCSNCHQTTNLSGAHMPPGDPDWHLPPKDMPMVFEKKTARELCLQFKDPAQNGNRTPKQIVEHLQTSLVLWGWNPGEGRTPIPMPYEEFVKEMTEWVEKGVTCPE